MDIKKTLRDSIIAPTLTYVSETWTWNEGQRCRIQAAEMSYLRGACGLNKWMVKAMNVCMEGLVSPLKVKE